ncbi:MAG TPA: HDOD domain-containing protein [Clostridia bacterium]|nr:HDOD domain-containing protein [Clostridia bacterium]
MTYVSMDNVRVRVEQLKSIQSVPAILIPLLHRLDKPTEDVDIQKVVELIAHDNSLAAQTLHMANSPLYGRRQTIGTVRGAVLALGVSRVREIATACCVLNLLPQDIGSIDPRVFWEHSLGCALVSRRFARKIGFAEPEKAYLAGLLHDLGFLVNLLVLRDEFRAVAALAYSTRIPLEEAEARLLGFTHGFTGDLLAEAWDLGSEIKEVIRRHHQVERATSHRSLVALVSLSDLLCRTCGLGYGYTEALQVDSTREYGWQVLMQEHPALARFDWFTFAHELDAYVKEVRQLVAVLFRIS